MMLKFRVFAGKLPADWFYASIWKRSLCFLTIVK